jgi:hypothetical protein
MLANHEQDNAQGVETFVTLVLTKLSPKSTDVVKGKNIVHGETTHEALILQQNLYLVNQRRKW